MKNDYIKALISEIGIDAFLNSLEDYIGIREFEEIIEQIRKDFKIDG